MYIHSSATSRDWSVLWLSSAPKALLTRQQHRRAALHAISLPQIEDKAFLPVFCAQERTPVADYLTLKDEFAATLADALVRITPSPRVRVLVEHLTRQRDPKALDARAVGLRAQRA